MAKILRTRQRKGFSLPFAVYGKNNHRLPTTFISKTGKYTREKDVAERAPA